MKLSISLPEEDLVFLDTQASAGHYESRSAVILAAIRLMRDRQHVDSYAAAWDEWDDEGPVDWDTVTSDGLS